MGTRVLMKPEKEKEKVTEGGIILPQTSVPSDNIVGEVLEVGPEVKLVNKGDRIMVSRHDGTKIDDNVLVQEAGILVVL